MAVYPGDAVRPLKLETPDESGYEYDEYPTELDPQDDAVNVKGVVFQDDKEVYISKDGNDLVFNDRNNTEKTLTELSASGSDEKVKVSSNDTTASYLFSKLVEGHRINLTEINDGANETLKIGVKRWFTWFGV